MYHKLTLSAALLAASFSYTHAADDFEATTTTADGVTISVDGGWSQIYLPEVNIGARIIPGPGPIASRFDVGDSTLDGYRLGLGVHSAPTSLGGIDAKVGIKGFYSSYDGDSTDVCVSGATICEMFPLFDPGPGFDLFINTFAAGLTHVTEREANEWGVALEAVTVSPAAGTDMNLTGGVAFRRSVDNFHSDFASTTAGTPSLGSYDQEFSTDYWGAYVGADGSSDLGNDVFFNLNGEAGVYYANTNYDGTYFSDQAQFGTPVINQNLSLSNSEVAVIVSGRAEIVKKMGVFELAGYVLGEYNSYAPEINYNDTDTNPAGFFGGAQVGTAIGSGSAMSVTVGAVLRATY